MGRDPNQGFASGSMKDISRVGRSIQSLGLEPPNARLLRKIREQYTDGQRILKPLADSGHSNWSSGQPTEAKEQAGSKFSCACELTAD